MNGRVVRTSNAHTSPRSSSPSPTLSFALLRFFPTLLSTHRVRGGTDWLYLHAPGARTLHTTIYTRLSLHMTAHYTRLHTTRDYLHTTLTHVCCVNVMTTRPSALAQASPSCTSSAVPLAAASASVLTLLRALPRALALGCFRMGAC
jgi:hypothetical protein